MESKGFVEDFFLPPPSPTFFFFSFFYSDRSSISEIGYCVYFSIAVSRFHRWKERRGGKEKKEKNGQIIYVRPDRSSGIGFSSILDACAEIKRARSRSGKQLEIQVAQLRSIVRSSSTTMIHNRNLVVDVSPPSCWSVDRVHFFEWSVELPRIGWKLVRVALSTSRDTVRERRSNLEMEVSKYNKYLQGKRIPIQFGRNYDSFAPYLPVYRGKLLFIINLVSISSTYIGFFELYPISI